MWLCLAGSPAGRLPSCRGWAGGASGKSTCGCKEQRPLPLTPVIRGLLKGCREVSQPQWQAVQGTRRRNSIRNEAYSPTLRGLPLLMTHGQSFCLSPCLQVSWHICSLLPDTHPPGSAQPPAPTVSQLSSWENLIGPRLANGLAGFGSGVQPRSNQPWLGEAWGWGRQ